MTNNEMYKTAKSGGKNEITRFMRDMKKAGLKMKYYQGRNFWTGPGVTVKNIQDVLSNTKVKCQWDNMGLDYIVYPKEYLDFSKLVFQSF